MQKFEIQKQVSNISCIFKTTKKQTIEERFVKRYKISLDLLSTRFSLYYIATFLFSKINAKQKIN